MKSAPPLPWAPALMSRFRTLSVPTTVSTKSVPWTLPCELWRRWLREVSQQAAGLLEAVARMVGLERAQGFQVAF